MICCILMLSSLVSSVWGTCVVKVAQSSYQAEENGDVTLEWTFTSTAHSSSESLFILCRQLTVHKPSVLFRLHEGVEVPESQDEQFSGRVQWDTDVLREGRLRLHVSRLRTEDSGSYVCKVSTDNDGVGSDVCRVSVAAAGDEPKPQRPTVSPQPESQEWTRNDAGQIAARPLFCVSVLLLALYCYFRDQQEFKTFSSSEQEHVIHVLENPFSLTNSNLITNEPPGF